MHEADERGLKFKTRIAELEQTAGAVGELTEVIEAKRTQEARLQAELDELRARFDNLAKIDTNVWIAGSAKSDVPPFVRRDKRRTRFVTFLNFKGGVGKTTLTANLAAAFATGVLADNKSVLAIDLDYQGTLGNLCVEQKPLLDRRANRQTAAKLLESNRANDVAGLLSELLVPMNGTNDQAMVVVSDDSLDQVDFRKQALFAVGESEERFHHRRLLHQQAIFDRFDFVFFDCPPRLSTSTINALAASDWIVIPTALDLNDIEAVPRTLSWMQKLQKASEVDFHAQLGGVILNGTYRSGTTTKDLTQYEVRSLAELQGTLRDFKEAGTAIIKHTVKNDNKVPQAVFNKRPYAVCDKGRELYGNVARELYERIKV